MAVHRQCSFVHTICIVHIYSTLTMIGPGSVFSIDVEPTIESLGAVLGYDNGYDNGKLSVINITEKLYLHDEGVQKGDYLIAVNGEDASNLKPKEAAELLMSLNSNGETIVLLFERPITASLNESSGTNGNNSTSSTSRSSNNITNDDDNDDDRIPPAAFNSSSSGTTISSPTNVVCMNKEEMAAWKKLQRQQMKRKLIKDKMVVSFADRTCEVLLATPPERKPFIEGFDNMNKLFNIGDYVKVSADTSPGKNREEGYGFIINVRGYAGATIVDVEYTRGHHGGIHKDITINHITPAAFGSDWDDDRGRKRRKVKRMLGIEKERASA